MAKRPDPADSRWMALALRLAARGVGRTAPNPAVGCVLVREGIVVGRGWTAPGGRPHAEAVALAQAGTAARGATAYVSLEPCAHHGRTPPCADALIDAGVARVVVALEDPDERVDGTGIRMLADAGIEVSVGEGAEPARRLNEGFLLVRRRGRPFVTLKLATSLDGRMATAGGDSQWITGPAARRRGHLLRARHDAVLTGIGTVLADDPLLTCRLPGMADRSPVRVVADSRLRLPATARLVEDAATVPTWIVTTANADTAAATALREAGCEVLAVDAADGGPQPAALLTALAGEGVTRLLVEAGPALATAFLRAGLVDALAWFRGPRLIGGDGLAAVGGLDVARLAEARGFVRESIETLGDDVLESYRAAH